MIYECDIHGICLQHKQDYQFSMQDLLWIKVDFSLKIDFHIRIKTGRAAIPAGDALWGAPRMRRPCCPHSDARTANSSPTSPSCAQAGSGLTSHSVQYNRIQHLFTEIT